MPVQVKLESPIPDRRGVAPRARQIDDDDIDQEQEGEEEDEIVREIDVYLSPDAAKQLYLLQYPLQKADQQISSTRKPPVAARIKPKHNMLELDYSLPTHAIETEGQVHLNQRTFASHTVPVTTHLALGKLTDNGKAIHLAPLQHITQMRPTFKHIDDNDMDNIRAMEEQQEKAAAAQARLDRKPLMFQKKESERAAMARKNSYEYKKASEDGEYWIELQVLDLDDVDVDSTLEEELPSEEEIQQIQQKMECPKQFQSTPVLDTNAGKKEGETDNTNVKGPSLVSYVRSLDYLPPQSTGDQDEFTHPNVVDWIQNGLDETAFDLPTLGSHMTALLRDGWPIPYSILRQTVPPKVKDKDVLTALSSCSVLLRGNFCLQSRLISKLPKAVAKARTFIMLLLQATGVVHRTRLDFVYGLNEEVTQTKNVQNFAHKDITSEIILMLLEQLGKKTENGWILRGQDDIKFVARHAECYELHMQYWARQMIRFRDYLECYANASAVE